MRLSIAIPCLNEAQTIQTAVGMARDLVAASGGDGEVVVGDNGSDDGSRELAERAGARVVSVARRGYGFALMAAIVESRGDVIVMGDADATYDFREAAPLVEAVASGQCDLAMGSRLRGRIEKGAMPFLHRWLGTPVLSWLIRRFFGLSISDCNCGMRAFSRDAFKQMRLVCGGMEFASEMLVKAAVAGLRVREFPVSLRRDLRTDRIPHLHTWRDGWRHLRFLLLFAPHAVFRLPGAVLIAGFGVETAALCLGRVTIGGATLDYHHLFYSIPLFCIGQQLLWFNAFAMRFRRFAGLGASQGRFALERWLVVGGFAALAGVCVFASVLASWLASGREDLFAVRRCSVGLALLLSGALCVMNALMTSMLELHFDALTDATRQS